MANFQISTDQTAVSQTLSIWHTPMDINSRVALWCLENNHQLKIYQDLLKIWSVNFSAIEILAWPNKETPSIEILTKLHTNQPVIILTTVNNLDLPIPAWQYLKQNKLNLKLNQNIYLTEVIKILTELKLSRETDVWENNTFSVQGSLINILQNNILYRLNIWENKLESITIDDILTKKERPAKEIDIWPASIIQKEQLINNLPNRCLLIGEKHWLADLTDLKNDQLIFDNLAPKPDFQFITKSISMPQDKSNFLTNYSDWQIFWFTKNQTLAKSFIAEIKLPINFIDWQAGLSWPQMTELPKQKILIINDTLFFWEEQLEKQQQNIKQFTPDWQINDLVVHRDHGIGKLEKITSLEVNGATREYLVLVYADNDTLFVPLDLADKVEKYVGPANPKINRLSVGNSWPQTLRKIKAETWVLANQLLQVEATRKLHQTPSFNKLDLVRQVATDFEFTETPSQAQAIADVLKDLKSLYPADRLICGDVGFGKTEVALRAAALTVDNGWQTALLCPTTLLAQQHYDNFVKRLEKYGVQVALLTRWQNNQQIKQTLEQIKNNQVDIIIGTHRLLSRDIHIPKLQLLIIDEEQNFGVEAKEKLKKHKAQINILTLSATPIPRTLNMALSLIKDISLITHPISDRKNIITQISQANDEVIFQAIDKELARYGQVYFLHNRVETIDFALNKIAKLFPQAKIAVAHGQLDDKTLATTMHDFDIGKIDILVCSTIIANGLDIPRANTLIITEADRFGLGQLHQLRGRIGRSNRQAYAYFLYNMPKLPNLAAQRLSHLKLASGLGDGFKIAHKDLELRGVGQILGKAQSGKVKTIGLGLYQQLIAETVAEIKGSKYQTWRDIELKLNLDTSLPKNFFKTDEEKLSFYQKISKLKILSGIDEQLNKVKNPEHHNILWQQKIRVLAQDTNITEINTYHGQDKKFLSINFLPPLDYKKVEKLLSQNPNWKFTDSQLKIDQQFLIKKLTTEVEKIVELFKK